MKNGAFSRTAWTKNYGNKAWFILMHYKPFRLAGQFPPPWQLFQGSINLKGLMYPGGENQNLRKLKTQFFRFTRKLSGHILHDNLFQNVKKYAQKNPADILWSLPLFC